LPLDMWDLPAFAIAILRSTSQKSLSYFFTSKLCFDT